MNLPRICLAVLVVTGAVCAQKGTRIKVPADHKTIMDAMDAASAGAVIEVARGVYNESVTLKAGVELVGKGVTQTFVRGEADVPVLTIIDAAKGSVRGIAFEHPKADAQSKAGEPAVLIASDDVELVSCAVKTARGDGISIESGKSIVIDRCEVSDSFANGITIMDAVVTLKSCKVTFNGVDGVRIQSGANVTATRLTAQGNKDCGIDAEGDDVVVKFVELTAKINVNRGVRLIKCKATFERPNIVANDAEGLYANGARVDITGGTIKGNKKNGLALSKGTQAALKEVAAIGNELTGISVAHKGVKAIIEKAETHDNRNYGILIQQGAYAEIRDSNAHRNVYTGISASDEGTEAILEGCEARNNQKHGMSVTRKARGTLTRNVAEANKMQGMGVFDKATATLVRNTSNRNGANGIQIWKGGKAVLEKNTCDHNTLSGVEVNGTGSTLEMKRNRFRRNKEYGVRFCAGATPFRVGRDNQMTKNRRGKVKK